MATARKTYRKIAQSRKAAFSLCLLLPFCLVFLVEMSCLLGKLPITSRDCAATNLCHGHSERVAGPVQSPETQEAHGSGPGHGSHEHTDHAHGHHQAASNADHGNGLPPVEEQVHTTFEGHRDHGSEKEVPEFIGGYEKGGSTLENCCIDDSVRFFSTPTYIQSNDASTTLPVPLAVFCGLPRTVLLSFEEKTASFKPPENEAFPPFPRFARFQVLLI